MPDTATMHRNEYVTAFFDNEADAEAAVARIAAEGIPRNQIHLVAGNADPSLGADTLPSEPRERGFFEALADLFMPEEDRYAYAEGLSRGGFLVSLNTTPENHDRILDILDDEGTVDMDAREESWRAEGWQGYQSSDPAVRPGMTEAGAPLRSEPSLDVPSEETIEVVEENLRVGKRDGEQGRVRVRTYVVETPVEEEVSLREERKPVDRAVAGGAASAFVDRTIEATETSGEAVVSKEARVTEEISLGKTVGSRTETIRDTVRHTEVEVEDDRLDRDK